ncbi:hypothetical protein FISHEDRAFT_75306 [Fistulina hepatica ATCC 64428]|uniref:ARM repeat-containing protein n=1 Tax=Fistulina hepatica ATCC 64428 TaxID=1128425 RepID=A0A0D7A7P2_9AGAR|nr:hypothetical protein FISHEDRAFT_75306 [Fistulina hepatica ATCC 64428]
MDIADIVAVTESRIRQALSSSDNDEQRFSVLLHLIELSASTQPPELKILAAQNIGQFFRDAGSLEEEALNAVYDLCEDASIDVRLHGYMAITQVSKADRALLERNVDVLIQLLQAERGLLDTDDELQAVKQALLHHLQMDSGTTLSILCHQLTSSEELGIDQYTRDRIRPSVISFLATEAKATLLAELARPGGIEERVLVDNIISALPRMNDMELRWAVKGLLTSFPSYKARQDEILQTLTDVGQSLIQTEASTALQQTRHLILLVMSLIKKETPLQHIVKLLNFYNQVFLSTDTLRRLPVEEQQDVGELLSAAIIKADEQANVGLSLWAPLVDSISPLVQYVFAHSLPKTPQRNAFRILLVKCCMSKNAGQWTPPSTLRPQLEKLMQDENMRDVYLQMMPFVAMQGPLTMVPKPLPVIAPPPRIVSARTSIDSAFPVVKTQSLPARPLSSDSGAATKRSIRRSHAPLRRPNSATNQHIHIAKNDADEVQTPPMKRRRTNDSNAANGGRPSLLSRLAQPSSSELSLRPRRSQSQAFSSSNNGKTALHVGFSIKGAAREAAHAKPSIGPARSKASLLQRLGDSSTNGRGNSSSAGRKRKR